MDWQIRNDLPIYSQLIWQMKFGIVSGEFQPGERISSVRELAVDAGVNPNTMQRALQELEREGLVYSQRTSGRYVTEDMKMIEDVKLSLADEQIRSFLDSMERLGYHKEEIISLLATRAERKEDENGEL